jgi:hypothetical protein
MKPFILTFFLSLIIGTTLAHGGVIMVNNGQSIQNAVNSANSGDEILLPGGVFAEDVVVNGKKLSLRSFGTTTEVRSISFINAPGSSTIQNLQLDDLNATNSDLFVKRATIGNNAHIWGGKFQILQSTITEKLTCKASVSHILYNDIRYAEIEGNSTITGNHFNGRELIGIGIDLNGSQTHAEIRNNRIHDYHANSPVDLNDSLIGIRVRNNAKANIINNLIHDCFDHNHNGIENRVGMGIYIESSPQTTIIGNILYGCYVQNGTGSNPGHRFIWAPASGTIIEYNLFWRNNHHHSDNLVGGGVVARNCINTTDPKLNYHTDGALLTNSPAINAGPPDPRFNDLDGSRNDIGMYGGHNFIPDGKTTNKPIVLGLDAAPTFVPLGGTITIESTGATVK